MNLEPQGRQAPPATQRAPGTEPGPDGHHREGRTTGEVEIDTSLHCDNLTAVRRLVAEALRDRPGRFVWEVQLVATELAANACDHADDPRHLYLRREQHPRRGTELVVEARDSSPDREPVVGLSTIGPHRGNGMTMVSRLCIDWGVRHDHDTKIVWGRLPMP